MTKIKNIEYNNDYIKIETTDKCTYEIAIDDYVTNLLRKAINDNKKLNKDIMYYEKCADICIYPIWIAMTFLVYAIVTNFVALDMAMILCGGMAGVSLVGTTVFKSVSKKFKTEANNNEYFNKIYQYAKNSRNLNNKVKNKTKQNTNFNQSKNKIVKSNQTNLNNGLYHLSSSQIIQDETISKRKR